MSHSACAYDHCCAVRYAEVLGVRLAQQYNISFSTDFNSVWRNRISSRKEQTQESWRSLGEEDLEAFKAEQKENKWGFGIDEIFSNATTLVKVGFPFALEVFYELIFMVCQYGLYDRPALKTWHKGRVVLLGDAAHPTTPVSPRSAMRPTCCNQVILAYRPRSKPIP